MSALGRHRGAVSADFRRFYRTALADAVRTWPVRDLVDAVEGLPPDSATARAELGDAWDWGHLAANVAELVDLHAYWLTAEYAKWTHDPEDPANKRAARELRRVKPPPVPIIPPVAHRPPSVAAAYQARHREQVAEFAPDPASTAPGKRWVSSSEFDLAILA